MWGIILVRLKVFEGHIGLELFSPRIPSQLKSGGPVYSPVLHLAGCIFREKLANPFAKRFSSFCNGVSLLSLAFEFVSFL